MSVRHTKESPNVRYVVLASVLALVLAQQAGAVPPLVIEARYPGAGPREVEASLAVPLEEALRGLDGVRRTHSVCMQGRCVLRMEPDGTVGRAFLRAEVIHRLGRARRQLPGAGKREGVLLLPDVDDGFEAVAVWADGKHERGRVADFASTHVRPRLARLPGVARVTTVAGAGPQIHLRLDPGKLAANNVTACDVLAVTRGKNRPTRVDDVGAWKRLVIGPSKDKPVRLGDVCRVEAGRDEREFAGVWLRGDRAPAAFPATLFLVHPSPGKAVAVAKSVKAALADLAANLPEGVSVRRWTVACDLTAVALRLPDGASVLRSAAAARRVARQMSKLPGVGDGLWFARSDDVEAVVIPFPAKDGRDPLADPGARAAIATPDAVARLRKGYDPVAPWPGRGTDAVVYLTRDEPARGKWNPKLWLNLPDDAEQLSRALAGEKGVVDASAELTRHVPQLSTVIDREKARRLGVRVDDVMQTLQVYTDSFLIPDVSRTGRERPVVVRVGDRHLDDLARLLIRNRQGKMVRLGMVCDTRVEDGRPVIYRLNGQRCAVVSFNVRGAARKDVEKAVRNVLNQKLPKGITPHFEAGAARATPGG
jgi:multidrug efflux pump subunit AcrB